MNVSLTPELEKFVKKEVDNGLYQTASEVIRAALRRLRDDQKAQLPQAPKTISELKKQLSEAARSIAAGEGSNGKEVLARMRQRSRARRQNA